MIYDWYNIFNLNEFLGSGLVSRLYTVFLDGVGQKDVLVSRGNTTAITYEGEFMPIEFANKNPYSRNGFAVFKDSSQNVWLGIEVSE